MAKFYGAIGFAVTEETSPGIWKSVITERNYYGDLLKNYRKFESPDKINGDVEFLNTLSIVADPYAYENFYAIRYVVFLGTKMKVLSVEVAYPRLNLSFGGEYHGDEA